VTYFRSSSSSHYRRSRYASGYRVTHPKVTAENIEAELNRRKAAAMQDDSCSNPPAESQEIQDTPSPLPVDSRAPAAKSGGSWPSPASIPDISDHQREQYAKAAVGSLGLLGGRPGTGKTFSLARILGMVPKARCAVAAPTGKAAVRITESLNRAGVHGVRATTIHSLLKVTSSDDGWQFEYGEDNPLPLDFIFLDEFSMCDTYLTGCLLAARAPGCRVLAIGDVNQLAPVGHGAPLRDLIAAGLPYGEMIDIQRNSGRIVKACHAIIDKKTFEPSAKLDLEAESPENLIHVERKDPEQQIETLKGMLEKFRQGAKLAGETICPTWQTQIIVPVNDKSPLARRKLNTILQAFLNPMGEQFKGKKFRIGDKVVNGKNGWMPVEDDIPRDLQPEGPWNEGRNKEGKIFTCNGDLARIMAIFPRYLIARLWFPNRMIRIPLGQSFENEEGEEESGSCNFELAYALSCHKAQGAEFPVVITIADDFPGARMLCDRSWIYTALSRARILSMTLGQRETIEGMCRKSHIWNRKTMLVEQIKELQQAPLSNAWDKELLEV